MSILKEIKQYLKSRPVSPPKSKLWAKALKQIGDGIRNGEVPRFREWKIIHQTMSLNDQKFVPHIEQFEKTVKSFSDLDYIFEFGAGYGRLCRLIHEAGFKGQYVIFDFPELICLQKYYLHKNGIKNITFISDIREVVKPTTSNNCFISMSALEESPEEIFDHFLSYASDFKSFLLLFSGGRGKFKKQLMTEGDWEYGETDRKSVYRAIGEK